MEMISRKFQTGLCKGVSNINILSDYKWYNGKEERM